MPHKRAKRSIREADRQAKGYNLAPSAATRDDTPRGAARIFNAHKVQSAYRAAGRTNSEDTGEHAPRSKGAKRARDEPAAEADKPKKKKAGKEEGLPKIGQHESLGEYNRRIEALLRPGVSKAIKSAEAHKGQQARAAAEAKAERKAVAQGKAPAAADDAEEGVLKPNRPEKTFAEATQRRSVRKDVAQAPPSLPQMRLATKKGVAETGSNWVAPAGVGRMPLSVGQKRIMDEERERVVGLYRDMKAKRELERAKEREAAAAAAKGAKKGGKGKKKAKAEDE